MVTKVERTKVNLQKLFGGQPPLQVGQNRALHAPGQHRDHADGLALELRHLRSPFELPTPTAAAKFSPGQKHKWPGARAWLRSDRSACRRRRKKQRVRAMT